MTVHEVAHPFCKSTQMDGSVIWYIGCEIEQDRMGGDTWYAHGEGKKIITEVSRHTPPGYGEKVFFTTEYIDPDGNKVSRKRLQMLGVKAYERRLLGFIRDYEIEDA